MNPGERAPHGCTQPLPTASLPPSGLSVMPRQLLCETGDCREKRQPWAEAEPSSGSCGIVAAGRGHGEGRAPGWHGHAELGATRASAWEHPTCFAFFLLPVSLLSLFQCLSSPPPLHFLLLQTQLSAPGGTKPSTAAAGQLSSSCPPASSRGRFQRCLPAPAPLLREAEWPQGTSPRFHLHAGQGVAEGTSALLLVLCSG